MNNTCCFIGHRNICKTLELKNKLQKVIEEMIVKENIDTFLFGSKSEFNSLCREIVTKAKEKFPYIKRIFVRAEYAYINDDYYEYLLETYDDTYYPESILKAGKSVYIERNFKMIRDSRFCVFYYDENYLPKGRKSGTKIAYDYAKSLNKEIIRIE